MRPLEFDPIWLSYISSLNEEILIKKLLISHDPDARLVESHMLLHTVENVIRFGTPSQELVILARLYLILGHILHFN